MTEYHDAAHEAYRRLKWQEANRPPADEIEQFEKAKRIDARKRRSNRFRRSIA